MPKRDDLADKLKEVVGNRDMEDVVYRLVAIAVERRNKADEETNMAERRYCQAVVEVLNDCQRKMEEIK